MEIRIENPESFFFDLIKQAQSHFKNKIPEIAESYIVFMLQDIATGKMHLSDDALFSIWQKAENSHDSEKFKHYKMLGDKSIITLGFFDKSIGSSNVSEDYYRDMGRNGYLKAFEICDRRVGNSFSQVYCEMYSHFDEAEVLIRKVKGLAPFNVVRDLEE